MSGYYPQHNDLPQAYEPMVSLASRTTTAASRVPHYGSLAVNLLVIMRAITALSIRPVPAVEPAVRF